MLEGPKGLCVDIQGNKVSRNSFAISPGKYAVEFSAPGYRTEYRTVTIPAEKVFKYKVELQPVRASVLIKSTPAGAAVTIGGKAMGITPLVIRDLPAGDYTAEVSMRGYARMPLSWKINSERPMALHTALDSNHGVLQLTSTPSRAKVIVDGEEVGLTPCSLVREEGQYVVRLERSDCNPVERNVRIVSRKKGNMHIRLGQKPGSVRVTSQPAGAEIFINGVKRGVTPYTVAALEPGEYAMKLTLAGYDPNESQIKILPGVMEQQNINMIRSTGSAVFNVSPAGVEVFLNDKSLGVTRPVVPGALTTANFKVENLPPGVYTVTMFHVLGDPPRQSFTFRVRKNRHTAVKSRTMWIANCEITYHNGFVEKGYLREEKADSVTFSPEPGVQFSVEKSKIKKLLILKGDKK